MGKKKIAVIGGGVGAMSAVWGITSSPGWQDKFEITVYQLGWRLGGKGASGRGPSARIQEHGLHIFMGFYENIFRVLRQVFDEIKDEEGVFTCVEQAFLPHSRVGAMEHVDGSWVPWIIDFPNRPGEPGDGAPQQHTTVWQAFSAALKLVFDWIKDELDKLEQEFPRVHAILDELNEAARESGSSAFVSPERIRQLHAEALAELENRAVLEREFMRRRRIRIAMDLAGVIFWAMLTNRSDIEREGLGYFDTLDFQEFLKKFGARPETYDLKTSAPVRGFYDLVFAYENGKTDQANLAAGVALRSMLCVALLYKNSVFMKMRAGMGDTIFTPFYKALVKRGVKFKFFHRLKDMKLTGTSVTAQIDQLIFERQATVKSGDYDPFVRIHDLDCWPQAPLVDQLDEGEEILKGPEGDGVDGWDGIWKGYDLENFWTEWPGAGERTLNRGADFDQVILTVPPASHPFICPDAVANSTAWQRMLNEIGSVRTQALQLWMKSSVEGLGWQQGSTVVDGYIAPFNTWADMTDLINREDWPPDAPLGSIAYFCGPMPGGLPPSNTRDVLKGAQAETADAATQWLGHAIGALWPSASNAQGGLEMDQTLDIHSEIGSGVLKGQFWRPNISPSERYVLSLKGTTRYRLDADESGCANLFFAGDWTKNGFNAGCVEAAAMSGLRCSQAISGYPQDGDIASYW